MLIARVVRLNRAVIDNSSDLGERSRSRRAFGGADQTKGRLTVTYRAAALAQWLRNPTARRLSAYSAVGVLVAGFAIASIPSQDGRIYACYAKSSGAVRIVESAADCRTGETSISWEQDAPPPPHTLLISFAGDGAGTVRYAANGTTCTIDCLLHLAPGTVVTLSATADGFSRFGGWEGACSGTSTCTVTLTSHQSVRAVFGKAIQWATIGVSGDGSVTSSPAGIDCPGDCMGSFAYGTEVTLTATPGTGSGVIGAFAGVRCIRAPVNACTFIADQTVMTEVRFSEVYALTRTQSVSGTVNVSPQPSFCDPPGNLGHCFYPRGTAVKLTATPNSNAVFFGWFGDCTGTGDCDLVMNADHSVHASFVLAWTLSVSKSGTGTGTVTSSPAGISCGAVCSQKFAVNSVVTLTATPAPGSHFSHWAGSCSGSTPSCSVTMGFDHSAVAFFDLDA